MEDLKKIKDNLLSMLIALENGEKCDIIIVETIHYIEEQIEMLERGELYLDVAYDLLISKHHTSEVITQEYFNGDVHFKFYIYSHDYSGGTDFVIIQKEDIEKEILLRSKRK